MRTRTSFVQRLILSAMALILGAVVSASALTVHISGLSLSLDTAQPLPPQSLPEFATFYTLSSYLEFGDAGCFPAPWNTSPGSDVYLLGGDLENGIFLVADAVPNLSASRVGVLNEDTEDGSGDDGDPGTNAPPFTWPVSTNGLPTVDATNVPDACTAYLYQDQFDTNQPDPPDPPAYPNVPQFALDGGAPIYVLVTNDDPSAAIYMVDDSGITRPDGGSLPQNTSTNYPPGLFHLEITNNGTGFVTLSVFGVTPGNSYELLSCDPTLGVCWHTEKPFVADANLVTFAIPINTNGSALFWARQQPDLWLDILPVGTNEFNVDPNSITTLLHNVQAGIGYALLSSDSLSAGQWTLGPIQYANTGASTLAFTAPMGTDAGFFRAVAATLDTDGNGIPDYWELFYFGQIGIDPDADPDGDGWTNFQEWQNGTNPLNADQPFLIIITSPAGNSAIP